MATIAVDTFLDNGTARTAGEAWTINSGAKLTVRTDTRFHVGSPVAMTGSLGSQTITEGEILYDARNVRWLPFDGGSGNVPAIGTSITQAGVSVSYLLGVYDTITSVPTAPGSAMPADGFLKFREVTGVFVPGALTGIGASAISPDVVGWMEVVCDSAANITVPRLGRHTIRGDWFYLDNTNGLVGQVLQVPTNGGGAGTRCPGLWIETGVGTGIYELWPSLNGATNGWAKQHIGGPYGATDARQNFVKDIGSGQMQIGEASDLAATYASVAAQAGTYASIAHSCTYTWAGGKVTVYYSTGHLLRTGQTVHLDFTTGGALAYDGNYVVTVIDAYYYTVDLAGSGTGGNVTARPGHTITFAAHSLGVGDIVYCDFTTGAGVDGNYTIYAVTGTGTYLIETPHAVTTSGNVSVYSRYRITYVAHGLAVGNRVYLDFTSGGGVDGIFTIEAVAADTFDVVYAHTAADSGNVTVKQTIGNIPISGCKTRIPNVFLRECATGSRASNLAPNATIASRPEWATTTAGAIDFEYVYSNWYHNINQPYSCKHHHFAIFDTMNLTECAIGVDLLDGGWGMYGALDLRVLQLTSNFAGGTIKDVKAHRGNTPGTTDHAIELLYCKGTVLENVQAAIIQYVRSSGKGIQLNYCADIEINSCRGFNTDLNVTASFNVFINDYDHVDRLIGYTNVTTPYYAVNVNTKSNNVVIDGITFGYNGVIPNVHPSSGLYCSAASSSVKFRNAGTFASKLSGGTWRPNAYGMAYVFATGGNNDTLKVQRSYVDLNRTGVLATLNSDKNIIYESVYGGIYVMSAMAIAAMIDAGLNSIIKGCLTGMNTTTGQSSVYGTHFMDIFLGSSYGRFILAMNEPTAETVSQFTMVSGTAKFNSAGGILMGVVGNQAIWEDSVFRKGHTGFTNSTPTMSGGTIGNYTVEYQIDTGGGYGGTWKTANGTNLSGESVDPAVGFKMKVRITTTTINTMAITYLRFNTASSAVGQANLYDLDPVSLQITVLDAVTKSPIQNARVFLETDPGGVDLINALTDSDGIVMEAYAYVVDQDVTGRVRKGSAAPLYRTSDIIGTITDGGLNTIVLLIPDE